jgi:hypothetical protein
VNVVLAGAAVGISASAICRAALEPEESPAPSPRRSSDPTRAAQGRPLVLDLACTAD